MKYTILGFNQEKLIEYGLDVIDALILRYIVDFYGTGKMSTVQDNGKTYFWLKYSTLITEIPICKINSKDVLRRRLKKMTDSGILEHFTSKDKGTFSCYKLADIKYSDLVCKSAGGATQESEGCYSRVGRGATQESEQKTSLLKDPSIKDNNSSEILSSKKQAKPKPTPPTPSPKITWLTAYNDVHVAELGGDMNMGQAGREFKKLEAKHERDDVIKGWQRHCKEQKQYASPSAFASKPLLWIKKASTSPASIPAGHIWR